MGRTSSSNSTKANPLLAPWSSKTIRIALMAPNYHITSSAQTLTIEDLKGTHGLKQLLKIRLFRKLGQSSDVQLPIVHSSVRASLLASWIRDVDNESEICFGLSVVQCQSCFCVRLRREDSISPEDVALKS